MSPGPGDSVPDDAPIPIPPIDLSASATTNPPTLPPSPTPASLPKVLRIGKARKASTLNGRTRRYSGTVPTRRWSGGITMIWKKMLTKPLEERAVPGEDGAFAYGL